MTIAYIIAFALAGAYTARRDARSRTLLSPTAGAALWLVTAIFFFVFLAFGIPGSPAAWTTLFMPIGYHLAARHILSAHQRETDERVAHRHDMR